MRYLIILISLLNAFYIGVGVNNLKTVNTIKKEAKNVNAISLWITKEWNENWYDIDTLNKISNSYKIIFIFYFFGDDISREFVIKNKKKYFTKLYQFINFAKKLKNPPIIILNPEYNQNDVSNWEEFDKLQVDSIIKIKNKLNAKVGVCPGDFGNYNKIWDKYAWELFDKSIRFSAKISDFIAFQEMRALTKNSESEILTTPLRSLAFATYLSKKYKKPTFLAYLAISSYNNPDLQTEVFKNFSKLLPLFKEAANLIGINIFHYLDNPKQRGYFKEAEKFFGVKLKNHKAKPAFYYLLKFH